MIQRREAREVVLQALYADDMGEGDLELILSEIVKPQLEEDEGACKFAERLFLKTVNHSGELNEIIQAHAKNWRLDRLAVIDRQILRFALCELLHFEDIPTKVTINEAIEIAKKYSTSNSGKFVNGILDAALEKLKKEGRIQKKGRGLIESSIKNT